VIGELACAGFVRHYKTVCNFHGTLVNRTIIDDLENIFGKNSIKEFILGDFLSNTVCVTEQKLNLRKYLKFFSLF
jgi:hypothetical protein